MGYNEEENINETDPKKIIVDRKDCVDCGRNFYITQHEKEYYDKQQFTTPKRCFHCRQIKKAKREEKE